MKRNRIIYWIATVWLAVGLLSTAIIQIFKIQTEGAGGVQPNVVLQSGQRLTTEASLV